MKPNSSNNHMAEAVALSGYLSGSVDWWGETEGVIERESERKKKEEGREEAYYCLSWGTGGLEEVLTQTHFSETDSSI